MGLAAMVEGILYQHKKQLKSAAVAHDSGWQHFRNWCQKQQIQLVNCYLRLTKIVVIFLLRHYNLSDQFKYEKFSFHSSTHATGNYKGKSRVNLIVGKMVCLPDWYNPRETGLHYTAGAVIDQVWFNSNCNFYFTYRP